MDPVTVIVTALTAGAGLGVKDTTSAAVKDTYEGLKALVSRRLARRAGGELVLQRHEQDPQTWDRPLAQELAGAGAGDHWELVAAAQALMRLVDEAGSAAGKYQVLVQGSQGVQVGDHSTQHNTFGPPADR